MISCKDASRLLSDRQERKLGLGERWALRLHLWVCDECRRFARQLDALRRTLRRGQDDGVRCSYQELPSDARERIARALQQQGDDDSRKP